MRRTLLAITAAAGLGMAALGPGAASAAPAALTPPIKSQPIHEVQYWGARPYSDDGWERRQQWREWRRERDEARIAEAARQEAWRIEQEREQRRAWWRAQRAQQYGYGSGYYRSW